MQTFEELVKMKIGELVYALWQAEMALRLRDEKKPVTNPTPE